MNLLSPPLFLKLSPLTSVTAVSSGSPSTSSVAISWDPLGGLSYSSVVLESFLDADNL